MIGADPQVAPPSAPAGPAPGYAEALAALEARRRTRDDRLLRNMLQPRDAMNPRLPD